MFFNKLKNIVSNFILPKKIERKYLRLLWLFILLYIAIFLFLVFKRYYYFSYNISDLAIFNQTFFNTIHGRWFDETVTLNNYFADHFSPIIFLLLPFYFLIPSPLTLLSLQTIGLGLAAWPLFYLSKEISKNDKVSLLVATIWLLNPMLQAANLDENHLLYLVPGLVFATAYFYLKNKFSYFLLFFILALLVREDIALIMLMWAGLAKLDKKDKHWVISTLVLALTYFIFAISIIKSLASNDSYKFFNYYNWLGGDDLFSIIASWLTHPLAVIQHLLSWNNIFGILIILLPLLYLPLIKPRYLLLSLLTFLQLAMTTRGFSSVAYMTRFSLLLLPSIFISFIFSLEHIQAKKSFLFSKFIYRNLAFSKFLMLFTVVYFFIFLSPARHVAFKKYDQEQRLNQYSMLQAVPADKSITATNNFLPQLSNRQFLYNIDYVYFRRTQFSQAVFKPIDTDYLLLDYSDFLTTIADAKSNAALEKYWPNMPLEWREFLQNYSLIKAENNVLLWQIKNQTKDTGLKLYELQDKDQEQAANNFLFSKASILNQSHRVLKLTIQDIGNVDNSYLIRFYSRNSYFDMPLDYGLMTVADWQQKIASFYYYLNPSVESYQVFSWQGINKLGLEQQVYLDKKLEAITDKITFTDNEF